MGNCLNVRIKADVPFHAPEADAENDGANTGNSTKVPSVPPTPRSEGDILQATNVKSFTYGELRAATRNFRPDSVLGEGGFGSVYKGWIDEKTLAPTRPGTGLVIAVKRLNPEGLQGHREWLVSSVLSVSVFHHDHANHSLEGLHQELTEVNYLGTLSHPNLVKLIGYCLEDNQRLLVYEFMPRGSLENHLFRRGNNFQPLSWSLRVKVALGAARGLAFLHSAEAKVIYRDFKASNVLLDSDYTAKLSDFGLAKDGPTGNQTHVSTRVMGTYGYAAPEYLATGHLTHRSDVYSFGVVMLEMLSGRRTIDKSRPSQEHNLVEWASPFLTSKRKLHMVLDSRLQGQAKLRSFLKAAFITRQCLSPEPKLRPTMAEVVLSLEGLQEEPVGTTEFQTPGSQDQNPKHSPMERNRRRSEVADTGKVPDRKPPPYSLLSS